MARPLLPFTVGLWPARAPVAYSPSAVNAPASACCTREAAKNGCDGTDYTRSYTASSFVPYYAQRLSWASAGGVADGILASISKASRDRLRSRAAGQQ